MANSSRARVRSSNCHNNATTIAMQMKLAMENERNSRKGTGAVAGMWFASGVIAEFIKTLCHWRVPRGSPIPLYFVDVLCGKRWRPCAASLPYRDVLVATIR